MPYITQGRRHELIHGSLPQHPGELNYNLTREVLAYLAKHDLSYQTINDILGALDGAAKEFYRRVAIPYEHEKREANGDVYPD